MPNNLTLLAENFLLKKKLEIAQNWMKREVSSQVKKIAQQQTGKITLQEKACFLHENIDEIVGKKIQDFFGEIMLINIPYKIIENIISAEITYYNFRHNPKSDGFAVISSYHKALDIIIEEYITSLFRNFIDIKRLPKDLENNSLEKALHSVIHKNYSLSVGRIFHIMQSIKENNTNLPLYTHLFHKFLLQNFGLKELFLEDDNFYTLFEKIIATEVLGSKRHSGRITFTDTREARKLLVGELKDKECLVYKMMLLGEI